MASEMEVELVVVRHGETESNKSRIVQGHRDTAFEHYFSKKSSGLYRSGFVVLTVEAVSGCYDIVPSTFSQGQEGPFFLTVASSSSFKLSKTR